MSERLHRPQYAGFGIIECLIAVTILAIVALGATYNTMYSISNSKRAMRSQVALELAESRMEGLAATDPSTLDSTDNSSETGLHSMNVSFSRQTTVVVNADGSRTVTVVVSPTNSSLVGSHTLTSTFLLWGNN